MRLKVIALGIALTAGPTCAIAQVPADWPQRVSLARQYVALRHEEEHLSAMSNSSLLGQFLPFCHDPSCVAAAKSAARFAAEQSVQGIIQHTVERYAKGLTIGQLQELLRFERSSTGQAVTRLLDESEDDRRRDLGNFGAQQVLVFHDRFCASQPAVCATSKTLRALPAIVKAVEKGSPSGAAH